MLKKLLCLFGLHDWNKWDWVEDYIGAVQQRSCKTCNLYDTRLVGINGYRPTRKKSNEEHVDIIAK